MAGYPRPYTVEEERQILQFIISKNGYYLVRGTKLWKDLERSCLAERSWRSFRDHFLNILVREIGSPIYCLSMEDICNFEEGYRNTSHNLSKFKNCDRMPMRNHNEMEDLRDTIDMD